MLIVRATRYSLLLLLAVAAVVSGCTDDDIPLGGPGSRIGIEGSAEGAQMPRFLVFACPGEESGILTLRVAEVGEDGILDREGQGDDVSVWSIRELGGEPPVSSVVLGEAPPGYEEVTPFDGSLDPTRSYGVEIDDGGRSSIQFTPSDLEPGMFTGAEVANAPKAEWEASVARSNC